MVGLVNPVGLVTTKLSTHAPVVAVTDVTKLVKSNLRKVKTDYNRIQKSRKRAQPPNPQGRKYLYEKLQLVMT